MGDEINQKKDFIRVQRLVLMKLYQVRTVKRTGNEKYKSGLYGRTDEK